MPFDNPFDRIQPAAAIGTGPGQLVSKFHQVLHGHGCRSVDGLGRPRQQALMYLDPVDLDLGDHLWLRCLAASRSIIREMLPHPFRIG